MEPLSQPFFRIDHRMDPSPLPPTGRFGHCSPLVHWHGCGRTIYLANSRIQCRTDQFFDRQYFVGDTIQIFTFYWDWMSSFLSSVLCLHKRFLAICFDEEQAQLQGLPVNALYLLLLVLTAVSIVLLDSSGGDHFGHDHADDSCSHCQSFHVKSFDDDGDCCGH